MHESRTVADTGPSEIVRDTADQVPVVSVAIPTCNRPLDVERGLASLSRIRYPRWELIVVDQSDDDATRLLTEAWRDRVPKIVYVRLKEKNASAARNVAIQNATGDFLAFIDDDCTVEPDWLDRVSQAFAQSHQAQLIFGSVIAAKHDPDTVFVLEISMREEEPLRGPIGSLRFRGMGASMYLNLRACAGHWFDPMLGPGAVLRGAQDQDYAHRLLADGGTVLQTSRISVTHHGAQPYDSGAARSKLGDYEFGAGACHAKLLRCGDWIMLAVIPGWLVREIAAVRPHHALVRKPTHVRRVLYYLRGLRAGFLALVDRRSRVFISS
jgi:succinoglycan biosynthesis protein ExoM